VPIPADSERIAVGDVTEDGRVDLVVATNKWAQPTPDAVFVLPQRSDGGFGPAQSIQAVADPTTLDLRDLDDDGHLDVIVGRGYASEVLQIAYGAGGGRFEPLATLPVDTGPDELGGVRGVAIADIDGDGDLDLAASDDLHRVNLLAQTAPRVFERRRTLPLLHYPWAVAVADLTGDELPEILVGNYQEPSAAFIPGGCAE
jgi:hypothetical protein